MSKARLTFQSVLWNHAGKILEYLLMYATSIIIARTLGAEENGRFVGLLSLSQLVLVICSLGLETSLNKFIPQLSGENQPAKIRFILRRTLLIRVAAFFVIAAGVYVAFVWITVPFFTANSNILLLVFGVTALRSIVPLFVMILTAQLLTDRTARINVAVRVVEFVAIIVLSRFDFTVVNIFIVFVFTAAVHVLSYVAFARTSVIGPAEQTDLNPLIQFGGIFWINTIVEFVLGRHGDVLLLSTLLRDSAQAGLYDVAFSLAQFATMAMTIGLAGVTFATFARLAVSDQSTMDRFYAFSIRGVSLLTIPLFALLLINAGDVLTLLYSSRYAAAVTLLQGILAFRIVTRVFGGAENAEYLLSRGKVGTVVAFGVFSAVINVGLNIVLIPALGANGSVIAGGSANLVVNVLTAFAVFRLSRVGIQFVYWLKLAAICLAAAWICAYVTGGKSIVALLVSGILYVGLVGLCLVVMKPLSAQDTEWLSSIGPGIQKALRPFSAPPMNATNG